MQHNTATDYKDINFVNRFEENHGGIIKYTLILIHLNRKIILKFMMMIHNMWESRSPLPVPGVF